MQWISRYPEGGGLQSDLEALERMTADPAQAAETLVVAVPGRVPLALGDAAGLRRRPAAELVRSTTLAPDLSPTLLERLAPFDHTHRIDLEPGWLPGWGDSTVVVTPSPEIG